MHRKIIQKNIAITLVLLIGLSDIMVPSAFAVTSLYDGNLAPIATKEEAFKPITQQTKTTRTEAPGVATPEVLGLADMGSANTGAHLRLPVSVQKLEKQTYSADEDVMVTVVNPEGEEIDTAVLDDEGQEVAVMVEQIDKETTSELHISATNQFKPGKYTVVVTDAEGKQTKQDFTWGVLAFNTDKATYLPKENAFISMAVLDDKGAMVCDADVTLEITDPTNKVTTLTTRDGKIIVNPGCKFTEFTLKPDYETAYTVGNTGMYGVKLTAKTEKGSYTITDAFEVKEKTDFDIKRTSATRLYPPTEYPMNIEITANRDFTGVITETVPESFTITPSDGHNSYDDMDTVYLQGTDPGERLERKVLSGTDSMLEMPFNGSYTVNQGFGHELTDIPLKEFYSHHGLAGHDGIDFALPMGTPLFAVDEGMVLEAGEGDYGITVIIQHVWGRSYYGHLNKTTAIKGMRISKGSHIGYSGNTGESTGPHLHFGIKPNTPDMNNGYSGKIDPMPLLPKDAKLPAPESLSLADQGGVLSATDAAAIPVNASPSSTIIPSQTPEMPIEPRVSIPTAVTASESAESDFTVTEEEIKEEVKDTENPVHDRVKVIQWNVSLKKGEKMTLSYMYKAPLVSPQFYTVGPLKFFEGESEEVVFEESRKWQIAADAIGVGWYDYYWLYRKEIVIDNANVPATQTNFPVLIQITADAGLSANAQADGDDILFTDSTGKTKLDHEVESYSSGTLRAWVEVSSLSSAADTSIYMYYGNSVAAAQQNVTGTWSNNFVGVWHFDDNPAVATCSGGTKELCDATGNANHGNMNGGMTAGQEVAGKIGNAWDFISGDYAVLTDSVTLDTLNADMTITTWLNADNVTDGQYRRVISRGSPQFWFMELDGANDGGFLIDMGVDTCNNCLTPISTATWYYIHASTQDAPSSSLYYRNNVLEKNDPDGGAISTTGDIGIAAESGGTTPWDGKLDEMRLANVQRPGSWAVTEYNNQNNPAGFIAVSGTQETKGYAASPDQLMRHGKFFDSSFTEQPFIF